MISTTTPAPGTLLFRSYDDECYLWAHPVDSGNEPSPTTTGCILPRETALIIAVVERNNMDYMLLLGANRTLGWAQWASFKWHLP